MGGGDGYVHEFRFHDVGTHLRHLLRGFPTRFLHGGKVPWEILAYTNNHQSLLLNHNLLSHMLPLTTLCRGLPRDLGMTLSCGRKQNMQWYILLTLLMIIMHTGTTLLENLKLCPKIRFFTKVQNCE